MPVDRCYVPCAEESSYYKKHLQKKMLRTNKVCFLLLNTTLKLVQV